MPLTIFYKDNATLEDIDVIELDATLNEIQTFDQEMTKFPVENDVDISDHVRNLPSTITISGLISNFPVQVVANIDRALTQSAFANRVNVAYDKLLDIRNKKAICDVVAYLRLFSNMIMTNLSIPRSGNTGDALHFSATFRELRIVSTETGDLQNIKAIQDAENQAPSTKNGGRQTPAKVRDEDSVLFNLVVEPAL